MIQEHMQYPIYFLQQVCKIHTITLFYRWVKWSLMILSKLPKVHSLDSILYVTNAKVPFLTTIPSWRLKSNWERYWVSVYGLQAPLNTNGKKEKVLQTKGGLLYFEFRRIILVAMYEEIEQVETDVSSPPKRFT